MGLRAFVCVMVAFLRLQESLADWESSGKNLSWIYDIKNSATTQNQTYKLNPETGAFRYHFDVSVVDSYKFETQSSDAITLGCYGWKDAAEKWHPTNYVADSHGWRTIRDITKPVVVYPTDAEQSTRTFLENLPQCLAFVIDSEPLMVYVFTNHRPTEAPKHDDHVPHGSEQIHHVIQLPLPKPQGSTDTGSAARQTPSSLPIGVTSTSSSKKPTDGLGVDLTNRGSPQGVSQFDLSGGTRAPASTKPLVSDLPGGPGVPGSTKPLSLESRFGSLTTGGGSATGQVPIGVTSISSSKKPTDGLGIDLTNRGSPQGVSQFDLPGGTRVPASTKPLVSDLPGGIRVPGSIKPLSLDSRFGSLTTGDGSVTGQIPIGVTSISSSKKPTVGLGVDLTNRGSPQGVSQFDLPGGTRVPELTKPLVSDLPGGIRVPGSTKPLSLDSRFGSLTTGDGSATGQIPFGVTSISSSKKPTDGLGVDLTNRGSPQGVSQFDLPGSTRVPGLTKPLSFDSRFGSVTTPGSILGGLQKNPLGESSSKVTGSSTPSLLDSTFGGITNQPLSNKPGGLQEYFKDNTPAHSTESSKIVTHITQKPDGLHSIDFGINVSTGPLKTEQPGVSSTHPTYTGTTAGGPATISGLPLPSIVAGGELGNLNYIKDRPPFDVLTSSTTPRPTVIDYGSIPTRIQPILLNVPSGTPTPLGSTTTVGSAVTGLPSQSRPGGYTGYPALFEATTAVPSIIIPGKTPTVTASGVYNPNTGQPTLPTIVFDGYKTGRPYDGVTLSTPPGSKPTISGDSISSGSTILKGSTPVGPSPSTIIVSQSSLSNKYGIPTGVLPTAAVTASSTTPTILRPHDSTTITNFPTPIGRIPSTYIPPIQTTVFEHSTTETPQYLTPPQQNGDFCMCACPRVSKSGLIG